MKRTIAVLLAITMLFCINFPCYALNSRTEHEIIIEKDQHLVLESIVMPVHTDHGLTRAKFCKSLIGLCRDLGYTLPDVSTCPILFTDTKDPEISLACMLGYVNGVGDKLFAPIRSLTVEQAATMMHRFLVASSRDYFEMSVQADEAVISAASDWAKDSLRYMIGIGVVSNEVVPSATMRDEDSNVMMWRLYKKLGGKDILMLEEAPDDLLVTLGIATQDEISSSEQMTYGQVLEKLIFVYTHGRWEGGNFNEFLRSCVMEDIENPEIVDPDAPITKKRTLEYILTFTAGSHGCIQMPYYVAPHETEAIYKKAFENMIIDSDDVSGGDAIITKSEFFEMLRRTMFVRYTRGDVGGISWHRFIDKYIQ